MYLWRVCGLMWKNMIKMNNLKNYFIVFIFSYSLLFYCNYAFSDSDSQIAKTSKHQDYTDTTQSEQKLETIIVNNNSVKNESEKSSSSFLIALFFLILIILFAYFYNKTNINREKYKATINSLNEDCEKYKATINNLNKDCKIYKSTIFYLNKNYEKSKDTINEYQIKTKEYEDKIKETIFIKNKNIDKQDNKSKDLESDYVKKIKEKEERINLLLEDQNQQYEKYLVILENKKAILLSMKELIEILEIPKSKLETLSKPDPLIFANNVEILKKIKHQSPFFLQYFEEYLRRIERDIDEIIRGMLNDSPFMSIFQSIWVGPAKNSGLKEAISIIGSNNNRNKFVEILSNKDKGLFQLTEHDFWNDYLTVYFIPILNDIVKIFCYKEIKIKNFNMIDDFNQDNINTRLIDEIFIDTKRTLLTLFDIHIININLFNDKFNSEEHINFMQSGLVRLKNSYRELPAELEKYIIYDIYSAGIISEKLNISLKPKVVFKK